MSGAVPVTGSGAPRSPKLVRMSRWFGRPFLERQAAPLLQGRDAPDLEELSSSRIYHFIQENYERPSSSGESRSVLKDGSRMVRAGFSYRLTRLQRRASRTRGA
ncbi:hypothetical protein CEXT_648131 [Caerostris extrusa]|uniref:Uncharacterized protein n=1 Tax=Caerostris extrusa TaxID=172846 RepID=A0AAV4UDM2_CAEEX|nr:hypothetical protein CEXT_648131 [Caerostris extrusa]